MNFDIAIKILNQKLEEVEPEILSSSWIYFNAPRVYRFVRNNYRTENDHIDWDMVTRSLNRAYAKRWTRYRYKQARLYGYRYKSRQCQLFHPKQTLIRV